MGSAKTSHIVNGKLKKGFAESGSSAVKPLLKKSQGNAAKKGANVKVKVKF